MGVVYAGYDDALQRDVAIKLLKVEGSARSSALLREARAAARVTHPSVCTIYEVGEHEGAPFLVMELLNGESVAARLASGALGAFQASSILVPALEALDALHREGLVHLDLKPANIFLTSHGVKLLDFGLARTQSASDPTSTFSSAGLLAGTPALHGAGTGAERARGRANGHLRGGHPALRARDRRAAVSRRDLCRCPPGRDDRASAGAQRIGGARRHRPRRAACAGQGSGRSVRLRGGDGDRASAHRRSAARTSAAPDQTAQAHCRAAVPAAQARSRDRLPAAGPRRRPRDLARRSRRHGRALRPGAAGRRCRIPATCSAPGSSWTPTSS